MAKATKAKVQTVEMPGKRQVFEDDPDYPIATHRKGGQIELSVEVIHDLDGDALTEDVQMVVRRYLRSRGCNIEAEGSFYRPGSLWIDA